MSGNATLVERLRIGLMASAAFVRGNADAVSRMNDALDALDEVSVGIAELEADAKLFVLLHALAIEQGYMPDPGESAYDLLQRAIMSGSPADTRTAVLAERQAIVTRLTELGVPQAFTDVLPIWLRRCL